jgi:hypothetical protein
MDALVSLLREKVRFKRIAKTVQLILHTVTRDAGVAAAHGVGGGSAGAQKCRWRVKRKLEYFVSFSCGNDTSALMQSFTFAIAIISMVSFIDARAYSLRLIVQISNDRFRGWEPCRIDNDVTNLRLGK